ncbi:MAG TPA: flavodoxin [Alphaproteobacteria bacterium]|nr:flavodoxin [Alphaproteobacteria bacterium]
MKKILTFLTAILLNFNAHAQENDMSNSKSIVVYFSKTGEQYGVGTITEGNTAIVAKMIADQTGADLFEVKVKNDSYPAAYKALTEVALKEKQANARPEFEGDVANFADYDVVFLGTPNWWADMPMVLYSFIESHNWQGKKVAPFVTHEGSGLSSIPSKIKSATGAEVLEGLEMYGHIAQNSREEASGKVESWLKKLGF